VKIFSLLILLILVGCDGPFDRDNGGGNERGGNERRGGEESQTEGFVSVCDRTYQVKVHLEALTEKPCQSITAQDLSGVSGGLLLESNAISSLQRGDFDGLFNLTELSLNKNYIKDLPEGVFDDLINLQSLDLSENQITSLPGDMFNELTSLTSLHFYTNPLESLPNSIFDKLTNLESLDFIDCSLEVLPVGIFNNLVNLKYLEIYYNSFNGEEKDRIRTEVRALPNMDDNWDDISSSSD